MHPSTALPFAIGLVFLAAPTAANASIEGEVRAVYADSLDALEEVDSIILAGVDDFAALNDTAIDLHRRRLDAVQLHERVSTCGSACKSLYPLIEAAVIQLNGASDDLQDFASPYDFYLDWCCESVDSNGDAHGCVQPGGYMTQCLGICWSCSEGWSNEDGSYGCNGGSTQDCPL